MNTNELIVALESHRENIKADIGELTMLNLDDGEYYTEKAIESLREAYHKLGSRIVELKAKQQAAEAEAKANTVEQPVAPHTPNAVEAPFRPIKEKVPF